MATEQQQQNNNTQVNLFIRGMNSDTSYDKVSAELYVFGKNIRIAQNALFGQESDSNSREAIVAPVPKGKVMETVGDYITGNYDILAVDSIENKGVIIIKQDNTWSLYRVILNGDKIDVKKVFTSHKYDKELPNTFSTVMNIDAEDATNIYISTTVDPVLLINIDKPEEYNGLNVDDITLNRYYPSIQLTVNKLVSGQLKTSLVQYSYRFYKSHGNISKLSPLTKKIQIIDTTHSKESGNAEDTQTSMGVSLTVPISKLNKLGYMTSPSKIFDSVLVYRIQYIKYGEDPEIHLIFEQKIQDEDITFTDDGTDDLLQLSVAEYSAIQTLNIIPSTITLNLQYLFYGNVEDTSLFEVNNIDNKTKSGIVKTNLSVEDTSKLNYISDSYSDINLSDFQIANNDYAKYTEVGDKVVYGGKSDNISWQFVSASIPVHVNADLSNPNAPTNDKCSDVDINYLSNTNEYVKSGLTTKDYYESIGIPISGLSYDDAIVSSTLRSLRRGDVYRYGIIYYDKYGNRTDVNWMQDIRCPMYWESRPYEKKTADGLKTIVSEASGLEYSGRTLTLKENIQIKSVIKLEDESYYEDVGVGLTKRELVTKYNATVSNDEAKIYVGTDREIRLTAELKSVNSKTEQLNKIITVNSIKYEYAGKTYYNGETINTQGDPYIKLLFDISYVDKYDDVISLDKFGMNVGSKVELQSDGTWYVENEIVFQVSKTLIQYQTYRYSEDGVLTIWRVDSRTPGLHAKYGMTKTINVTPDTYIKVSDVTIDSNIYTAFNGNGIKVSINIGGKDYSESQWAYTGQNKSATVTIKQSTDNAFGEDVCLKYVDIVKPGVESSWKYAQALYEGRLGTPLFTDTQMAIYKHGTESIQCPCDHDIKYTFTIIQSINAGEENLDGSKEIKESLFANPIGIKFDVSVPVDSNITSFQIVRCAKTPDYSRTLMQCATSRPTWLTLYTIADSDDDSESTHSPCYPTGYLTSCKTTVYDIFGKTTAWDKANNEDKVMMLLSPEIYTYPKTSMLSLDVSSLNMIPQSICYADNIRSVVLGNYKTPVTIAAKGTRNAKINMDEFNSLPILEQKTNYTGLALYYAISKIEVSSDPKDNIDSIVSAASPTWDKGFTLIQHNGSKISAGVKAYKSATSIIKDLQYCNWVCGGQYDLRLTLESSDSSKKYAGEYGSGSCLLSYKYTDNDNNTHYVNAPHTAVGPGPQCLLVMANSFASEFNNDGNESDIVNKFGSIIVNMQHKAVQFSGTTDLEKLYDIYYGFGNYCTLTRNLDRMEGSLIVFDGDIYNVPAELPTMFKTYNFNSIGDSVPSIQVVNYVPLESTINSFFNYGLNYRNTKSNNLQIEPGDITGISTTARPYSQYNKIYMDNNTSIDRYNAASLYKSLNTYKSRVFYSDLKTNGELFNSWGHIQANNYIDGDTRYGEITHMLSDKNTIYMWQSNAFSKLSVNERSLVTDTTNNTVQLGLGGVLQRVDYLDQDHGMKADLRCAISVAGNVIWIDSDNRQILSFKQQVQDLGNMAVVQNIINEMFTFNKPKLHYDTQYDEVLAKDDDILLVILNNANAATSVYTRSYDNMIILNNTLYSIYNNENDTVFTKINKLTGDDRDLLSPMLLSFVVNSNPSGTKVFDNQQLVIMRKDYSQSFAKNFMLDKTMKFSTNIGDSSYINQNTELISDREGNIQYSIPRIDNAEWGGRLRGKWMRVDINIDKPSRDFSISHVITKFRQSLA